MSTPSPNDPMFNLCIGGGDDYGVGEGVEMADDTSYYNDSRSATPLDGEQPVYSQISKLASCDDTDTTPHADYYRAKMPISRPSMQQLLNKGDKFGTIDEALESAAQPEEKAGGYKFNWIEGVYVRCTLSIFGVIMFLRLNWIVVSILFKG
jgi:hypothetical protein